MLPVLILKSGRERSLINRHPWIFTGAVKTLPSSNTGDIIRVATNHGDTIGYGFFDSKSQIVCKMFLFTHEIYTLDFFDVDFWKGKLVQAFQLRRELILNEHTNACRLIHAEGDNFPGLIADIYNDTIVLQILHKGTENILEAIVSGMKHIGFQYIYIKTKESSKNIEYISISSGWIGDSRPQPVSIRENGNLFLVNVESGQKTGFFLDQRDNRAMVGKLAEGKKVLNAFSYTGGFSVYAGKGGAEKVVSVDISKDAVALAEDIMKLNGLESIHEAIAEDCFEYLKNMPEQYYDLIVLDPPAFAKSARMVQNAARGYKEINLNAFQKIKKGGLLFTYSCSKNIDRDLFRKIVFGAAADSGREVQILFQLTQPADHPINIYHPEGEYLKGLVLKVI